MMPRSTASPGTRRRTESLLAAVDWSVCLFVFPQFAVEKLTELERWKQELQDEAHTLIDFFCEDKETMKLDECLQIFRDFCVKFNKAVKVWPMASPCFLSCLDFCFSLSAPSPLSLAERWVSISTLSGKSGPGSIATLSVGVTGKCLCHPGPEHLPVAGSPALASSATVLLTPTPALMP